MKRLLKILFYVALIVAVGSGFAFAADEAEVLPGMASVEPESDDRGDVDLSLPALQAAFDGYRYNPLGKPDPFRPFVQVETRVAKKDEKVATDSIYPLQRAEVSKFRLVGIAGDPARRVAVVEDSARKFYPVVVGTRIGNRNGKVTAILADRVIVEEHDGVQANRIIMTLRNN